jgi:hypothetical protein
MNLHKAILSWAILFFILAGNAFSGSRVSSTFAVSYLGTTRYGQTFKLYSVSMNLDEPTGRWYYSIGFAGKSHWIEEQSGMMCVKLTLDGTVPDIEVHESGGSLGGGS